MIETVGRFVATEPFPVQHITGSAKGGLFLMDQKISLTRLKVLYCATWSRGEGVTPGSVAPVSGQQVLVAAQEYVQPWAKKVYELEEGKPFILVPVESIMLVEYPGV